MQHLDVPAATGWTWRFQPVSVEYTSWCGHEVLAQIVRNANGGLSITIAGKVVAESLGDEDQACSISSAPPPPPLRPVFLTDSLERVTPAVEEGGQSNDILMYRYGAVEPTIAHTLKWIGIEERVGC